MRQGEALGYVLNNKNLLIRLVIDQDNEELAQLSRIEKVSVRPAHRVATTTPTQITRVTPGGTQDLPSAALSQDGGGQIAVDPREKEGLKSLQRLFIMELEVPSSIAQDVRIGERVYVRFEHFSEPLFVQIYRRIRQSFLTYFAT
jgi:putative peptide zinc metalloprotease protein